MFVLEVWKLVIIFVFCRSAITSPSSDWGVPHQTKLKYTQIFNTTDRSRTGFLSAAQARNILIQSQLPQKILAQVRIQKWGCFFEFGKYARN